MKKKLIDRCECLFAFLGFLVILVYEKISAQSFIAVSRKSPAIYKIFPSSGAGFIIFSGREYFLCVLEKKTFKKDVVNVLFFKLILNFLRQEILISSG